MPPLLGTTWRHRPLGGGSFHCPRCDRERDYTATGVRRHVAVVGRPVVPVGEEQRLLSCDGCGAVYDVGITTLEPSAARDVRSEDELALEALLTAAVFSDSTVRLVEKGAARQAVRHYARRGAASIGEPAEPEEGGWGRRRPDAMECLARLRGVLGEGARRRMLAAVYRVCAADRELHPEEARFLMRLGDALDLQPRAVREAMREGRS